MRRRAANQTTSKTNAERLERWRTDFIGFTGLLDILPKGGQRQKLILLPMQAAYCRARGPRDVVLKPRQVGFTTIELARDLWTFLTKPGARVVVVVQSMADDAAIKEVSEKLALMIRSLREAGIDLPFSTETGTSWRLPTLNSSLKVIGAGASAAAAAKKGRSGTITRLHLSEVAFFEFGEVTLNAILECVPPPELGTEIVIESTPNGGAGAFFDRYKAAVAGQSGYTAHFYPWYEQQEYSTAIEPGEYVAPAQTPREIELVGKYGVSPSQLKWYRQKVSEKKQDLVDQEYPTDEERCWLIAGRTFFDKTKTSELHGATLEPIAIEQAGAFRVWKRPQGGRKYLISADPSEGTGGDPGAAMVYDRSSGEHVATLHGQFPPWEFGKALAAIGRSYNTAEIVVERNNHGHAVLQCLEQGEHYANIYIGDDEKPGWRSTEVSRTAALDALESGHREGEWTTPDKAVTAEMMLFIVNKKGKAEASTGAHDDLVITAAIGWDVMSKAPANIRKPTLASTSRWGTARGRGFG